MNISLIQFCKDKLSLLWLREYLEVNSRPSLQLCPLKDTHFGIETIVFAARYVKPLWNLHHVIFSYSLVGLVYLAPKLFAFSPFSNAFNSVQLSL